MTTLNQQDIDGVRVVRVSGSLTQDDVNRIEPAFAAALPDGSRAVIDLAGVDLITTPGLSLIIAATQRLRGTMGKVVFSVPQGAVLDLMKRCRLQDVLEIEDDSTRAAAKAKS